VDSPNEGVLRIRAIWGQTGFLSQVESDIYIVSGGQISSKTIGLQKDVYILDKERESFVKKVLPEEASESQVLEDEEVLKLAEIASHVFEEFGSRVVEFGVSQGIIYIINLRRMERAAIPKVEGLVREVGEIAETTLFDEKEDFISSKVNDAGFEYQDLEGQDKEYTEPAKVYEEPESFEEPIKKYDEPADYEPAVDQTLETMPGQREAIEGVFRKFATINPSLKNVLDLLKEEIFKELK
jgi:phosphoenolpyruvate synthase/pyruvate phosphate dikinase